MKEEALVEVVEHTADVGLRAQAPDLPSLFSALARATTDLITNVDRIEAVVVRCIQISATDLESLLVEWLNELIYLMEAEGLIFNQFQLVVEGTTLQAKMSGEPLREQKHEIKTQIKACTYHNLRVEKVGLKWEAEVLFDI